MQSAREDFNFAAESIGEVLIETAIDEGRDDVEERAREDLVGAERRVIFKPTIPRGDAEILIGGEDAVGCEFLGPGQDGGAKLLGCLGMGHVEPLAIWRFSQLLSSSSRREKEVMPRTMTR